MIVLIDNYDSFTYNLVQYLSELGADVHVVRNDEVTVDDLIRLRPDAVVISPGPSDPDHAGVSLDVVRHFSSHVPTLGVCLGHQCIGQAFGGSIVRAPAVVHGKVSSITHTNSDLFHDLPNPMTVVRYHSLTIDPETLPAELEVTARTDDGTIMAVRHMHYPLWGVQFHPESIMTQDGKTLLQKFLCLARSYQQERQKTGAA